MKLLNTPIDSLGAFAIQDGAIPDQQVLPAGAVFPFDFGFIPATMGDDGDPLAQEQVTETK